MTNVVTLSFVALQLVCGNPGGWTFTPEAKMLEPGVEELTIVLENAAETVPPEFRVAWSLPQRDIPHFWNVAAGGDCGIPPDWGGDCVSSLTRCAPVYSLFSAANENRLATAADDARRTVRFKAGLCEETCTVECSWRFFAQKTVPSRKETVRIRFDTRKVFWSDAVRDASDWIARSAGYVPLAVPDAARAPLYSAWYSFHQDVHAKDIEEECAIAALLGMKTLIVDDGWQTDDTNRGYDFCGDWEMSKNRFPDMAAHVKKVHALGMKYMIWYSVPFVGVNSKAATAFKGKFLREPRKGAAGILDPRVPEAREYLAGLYEKALREWDLDGLKLDFIDAFGSDPGVPEAVDALMTDVARRLKAIKPEVLIEFRQSYIGPAIRTYGNMLRVADCPGNADRNRTGTAWLRLTSGDAAVHSDMLEWHPTDTAENAARFILCSIFGTVQYSMMLRRLPASHLRMMRHWIEFTEAHKQALQLGDFKVPYPQLGAPFLVGESAEERIIGVYCPDLAVDTGAADRKVLVLNATPRRRLALWLAKPCDIVAYDTFGREAGHASVRAAGLHDADCPVSGHLEITFAK